MFHPFPFPREALVLGRAHYGVPPRCLKRRRQRKEQTLAETGAGAMSESEKGNIRSTLKGLGVYDDGDLST